MLELPLPLFGTKLSSGIALCLLALLRLSESAFSALIILLSDSMGCEKLIVTQLIKKSLTFMEYECSLLCPQEPASGRWAYP
jgi:hypothetical protein